MHGGRIGSGGSKSVCGNHATDSTETFTNSKRSKMALLGKQIKMKGVSQRGKNRIREHGDEWTVLAETDRVLFAPSQSGPWLFITPTGRDQYDKASRWVKANGDLDFTVVVQDG